MGKGTMKEFGKLMLGAMAIGAGYAVTEFIIDKVSMKVKDHMWRREWDADFDEYDDEYSDEGFFSDCDGFSSGEDDCCSDCEYCDECASADDTGEDEISSNVDFDESDFSSKVELDEEELFPFDSDSDS